MQLLVVHTAEQGHQQNILIFEVRNELLKYAAPHKTKKNINHRRVESMKQKLCEMVKVTVPIFFYGQNQGLGLILKDFLKKKKFKSPNLVKSFSVQSEQL